MKRVKKCRDCEIHARNLLHQPEKTALAITIANREKDILKTIDYEHGYSLYIGIPFCPSICLYCSFGSHVLSRWEHMVDPYLDALIKELIFISENMKDYTLDTIYIGGGTPTTLNAAQMERLLTKVTELFPMEQVQEFTVEAGRPDTINEEVLKAIRKFPVTRISINPQTMNQETLDLIGRTIPWRRSRRSSVWRVPLDLTTSTWI